MDGRGLLWGNDALLVSACAHRVPGPVLNTPSCHCIQWPIKGMVLTGMMPASFLLQQEHASRAEGGRSMRHKEKEDSNATLMYVLFATVVSIAVALLAYM